MKNPSDKGFSLIELSVVLVIIGILVAISLSLGTSQIQISNISSTKSKLDRIEDAMIMYYKTNHALPCPAPSAADMSNSSSNFGQGSVILNTSGYNDATCPNVVGSYTIPSSSPASVIYYGVVPVRDLGISDDYMFDAWGNRLTYAVSKFCVDPNDWSSNNTYKCAQSATPTSEGNNITVLDAAGTARPTKAAYVIISHGKDGYGAYNRKGAANPTGTNAPAQEQANAKTYTSPADATFRDAFINDGTVVARYFDDIVRWKPAQLFDTDAAATTNTCDTVLNPIIKGYTVNNYYYPCSDKDPATSLTGSDNYSFGNGAGYSLTSGANNIFMGKNSGNLNAGGNDNIFLGFESGKVTTTGSWNIFMGRQAGTANTTGVNNIFLGNQAGMANTTGYYNLFLGYAAGKANTTGTINTFLGYQAGTANTTGFDNTFLGYQAGTANTTGIQNIFMGSQAGVSNQTGNRNIFLVSTAGYSNTIGNDNIFLGLQAGYSNTTGNDNIFQGYQAGYSNTTGLSNIAIGNSAGQLLSGGTNNIFLGPSAGINISDGGSNIAIGSAAAGGSASAGQLNTGFNNIAIGVSSGSKMQTVSGTAPTLNVLIGNGAGLNITNGNGNVFIGGGAGANNTTQSYDTVVGTGADQYNSGTSNTIIGRYAMGDSTRSAADGSLVSVSTVGTGSSNTIVGDYAGANTGQGSANTYIGSSASTRNAGTGNVTVGDSAGIRFITGDNNVLIGRQAGGSGSVVSQGSDNVIIGKDAGKYHTGGSDNTFIGDSSGCSSSADCTVTNATAIGYGAIADTSNTMVLGNTAVEAITTHGILEFVNSGTGVAAKTVQLPASVALQNSVTVPTYGTAWADAGKPAGFLKIKYGANNYYVIPFYKCSTPSTCN